MVFIATVITDQPIWRFGLEISSFCFFCAEFTQPVFFNDRMDEDTVHVLPMDSECALLCTENKEFLYDSDGTNMALTAADLAVFPEPEENSNLVPELNFEDQSICSDMAAHPEQQMQRKPRKRNSLRDRLRSEAEQEAYRKLRELVPQLSKLNKKPTKLETIQNTCEYITDLQKTLSELEKQHAANEKI